MTRANTFRQADVTRAVKALKDAGETIAGVKIMPDGTIIALTGRPDDDARPPGDEFRKRLDAFKSGLAPKRH